MLENLAGDFSASQIQVFEMLPAAQMGDAIFRETFGVVAVEFNNVLKTFELFQPRVSNARVRKVELSQMTHLRHLGKVPVCNPTRGEIQLNDIALSIFDSSCSVDGEGEQKC